MPFGDLLAQTWELLKENKRLLLLVALKFLVPNDFMFSGITDQYPTLVAGKLPEGWPFLPATWILGFITDYLLLICLILAIKHYQKQERIPRLFTLVRQASGLLGKTVGLWALEAFAVSLILSAALSLSQFAFAPEPYVVKFWITIAEAILLYPLYIICIFTACAIVLEELPFAQALDRAWLIFRKYALEVIITGFLVGLLTIAVLLVEFVFASLIDIVLGAIPIIGVNIALQILVIVPLVLLIILTAVGGGLFELSMFIIYYTDLSSSLPNSQMKLLDQSDMNLIS